MGLFPKDINFFELLDNASVNCIDAANNLVKLFENLDEIEQRANKIHELERNGDLISHEIFRSLNKIFITPIDREDIFALTSKLDDILDMIWGCADHVRLFKIKTTINGIFDMITLLQRNVDTINKAIHNLRLKKYSYVQELCIEINRLENDADKLFKGVLGELFETETNAIMIIKWKEVLEYLETAANRCEDVANVLETIIMKNA
ncbi:MAG: DUF47 domain-containing protein [Nitrospirae bacterium]|nr:DUF47 domain-containing protein [Nitrospirota bacterium]